MNYKQKTINSGRHAAECKICAHPSREEIERDFINWRSPVAIAKQYKLANRRHAHALGLFPKRQRNVRAVLEKMIERAGEVEVNATAVVSTPFRANRDTREAERIMDSRKEATAWQSDGKP
jgi:hypothetical protein